VKKVFAIIFSVILLISVVPAGMVLADKPPVDEDTVGNPIYGGNGAPSGYHFTLNILGVDGKTNPMDYEDGSNRSSIFVPINDKTQINLKDGGEWESVSAFKDAFTVLDANGCDTDGALIQIPDPMYDPYVIGYTDMELVDHVADYTIYVKPLGKPGPENYATITTCAELINQNALFGMLPASDQKAIQNLTKGTGSHGGTIYASVEQVGQDITLREQKGKEKFTNVTAELTSVVFEVLLHTEVNDEPGYQEGEDIFIAIYYVRVPIFNDMLGDCYWEYDNNGLKHLQVRFYPVECDITYNDGDYQPILPQ